MSLNFKSLDGELNIAKTALYTCPENKKAFISVFCAHNKSGVTAQILLYKKRSGGSSRILTNIDLENRERLEYDDGIVLEAGDAVEGESPDGDAYWDYSLEMSEEDLTIVST